MKELINVQIVLQDARNAIQPPHVEVVYQVSISQKVKPSANHVILNVPLVKKADVLHVMLLSLIIAVFAH